MEIYNAGAEDFFSGTEGYAEDAPVLPGRRMLGVFAEETIAFAALAGLHGPSIQKRVRGMGVTWTRPAFRKGGEHGGE